MGHVTFDGPCYPSNVSHPYSAESLGAGGALKADFRSPRQTCLAEMSSAPGFLRRTIYDRDLGLSVSGYLDALSPLRSRLRFMPHLLLLPPCQDVWWRLTWLRRDACGCGERPESGGWLGSYIGRGMALCEALTLPFISGTPRPHKTYHRLCVGLLQDVRYQ